MQRLSYPTETVLSNTMASNRIVLSFKDSAGIPLRRRPSGATSAASDAIAVVRLPSAVDAMLAQISRKRGSNVLGLPAVLTVTTPHNLALARPRARSIIRLGNCTVRVSDLLGGAATCSEGFVICFPKVSLSCLGSMAAAVQPNGLGNSQKRVNKTLGRSGRPTGYSVCNILHTL